MTSDTMLPMKFTVALWWLWRWRNEVCRRRISNIPGDKIQFLFMSFKEISNAWLSSQKWHTQIEGAREENLVGWEPPLAGWVTLNTDGASKGNPGKARG